MLADAVAYATIPARDLERAKRFYRDTLGLKVGQDTEDGVRFETGGSQLCLFATHAEGPAAGHTLATWFVSNLEAEMADLRARGVTFEEYDLPGLKTNNGVAETGDGRCAWFKDSEGNILNVTEASTS